MIGLTPSGRVSVVDVDGLVDVQPGDIDLDGVGNVVGRADQLDLVAHDVEHAALLQAGRFALALEVHRNFQAHRGAFGQAHEIDMHGTVADRIELQAGAE